MYLVVIKKGDRQTVIRTNSLRGIDIEGIVCKVHYQSLAFS